LPGTEAGLAEKAVVYWLKAGQQAIEQSATKEAVARCRRIGSLWPRSQTCLGASNTSWTCK
jgi:hypothetical protein